jgi:hypothetical protein
MSTVTMSPVVTNTLLLVAVFVAAPLVTVRVAEYVPPAGYVTTGFCAVDVDGFPPGKDQLYALIFPELVLVYCTFKQFVPVGA